MLRQKYYGTSWHVSDGDNSISICGQAVPLAVTSRHLSQRRDRSVVCYHSFQLKPHYWYTYECYIRQVNHSSLEMHLYFRSTSVNEPQSWNRSILQQIPEDPTVWCLSVCPLHDPHHDVNADAVNESTNYKC